MEFVTSADGTKIAVEVSGSGPPVVLLGGAAYGARAWAAVADLLAPTRTVYAVDRRGRGASGDAEGYATGREVADVRAVLAEIGEPATLFGHSAGGLLALRVARDGAPVRALVLYEPPMRVPGGPDATGVAARLTEVLAVDDREAALTLFLVDAVGIDRRFVTAMRRTAFWPAAVALAHTLPYDALLQEESGLDGLAELRLPTRLLLGERSDPRMRRGVETLAATLPDCTLVRMPGQAHNAIREAPELLVELALGNSV